MYPHPYTRTNWIPANQVNRVSLFERPIPTGVSTFDEIPAEPIGLSSELVFADCSVLPRSAVAVLRTATTPKNSR
jgi:hypothetical protein